jgi:hypothetical protein
MLFYPEKQDLRVHHHNGEEYVRLEPDAQGRILIPELDLQAGILNGWVRYWHRDVLLELPAESAGRLQASTRELAKKDRQLAEQARAMQALAENLRSQVEGRARKAGRKDILDQLPNTSDPAQLLSWLNDLP